MNYKFVAFFSFSIYIAGIISAIRYNKINKAYHPFLYCIWIACGNEIISFTLTRYHNGTSINNNIYVLLESLLLSFLFKNIGAFYRSRLFVTVIGTLIVGWLLETFVFGSITKPDIYFRVLYSFSIVLLSINTINEIIANNKKRNATFLLCIAFIIYFTFKVFVYAFWISGLSSGFLSGLFAIMVYINFLTNLIYAIAVLWMPRKLEFSLPY